MTNFHATGIVYQNKGALITGKHSGIGKSDLAFRMIMQKGAKLIADDYIDLSVKNGELIASAPKNIEGLIEVRGVGVVKVPFIKKHKINLLVELVENREEVERLPEAETLEVEGILLPKLKLYPFELSSLEKLVIALLMLK